MMCKWHLTHPLTSIMRTDRTDSITGCHRHCHILRGFQKSDCWKRMILLASFPPSFPDCLFLCLSCSRLPSMSSNCCLLWSDSWGEMKWFACCLLYCSENIYVMNTVHKNRGVVKEKAFVQCVTIIFNILIFLFVFMLRPALLMLCSFPCFSRCDFQILVIRNSSYTKNITNIKCEYLKSVWKL